MLQWWRQKTTPVSGHETTAGNLHLNANGFMLISNYWDNDVLIGGKIKFAWTLAIQTEVRLVKKRENSEGFICILICGMADRVSHITQRRRDYCVWLRLWRNSSQSKPKPSWYCTLTPVSWMKRGCWRPSPLPSVCSPQVHVVFDPVGGCVWTSGLIPAL